MMCIVMISLLVGNLSVLTYSEDDRNGLEKVIRIGFDPALPPYQFYEAGAYQGFLIDLTQSIFKELNVSVTFIPLPYAECLNKFEAREIDMILGLRYNGDLDETLNFSDSLVNSTISIVVPKASEDNIQKSIGKSTVLIAVERDSAEFEYVRNIKKANFNNTFNQEAVVDLMMLKRADMMIGVRHVAEYLLEKNNLTSLYSFNNSYVTPIDYYLAMNKSEEIMLIRFNEALKRLKLDGEYEKMYNVWIDDKNLENQKNFERFMKITGFGLVLALCVIFIAAMISVQLKKRVDEKTEELSATNKQLEHKIIEINNSNELKNLIFESSPRSIAIFDKNYKISAMNEPALALCKLTEMPVGTDIFTLVPLSEMIKNGIERVIKYGESYSEKEFEIITNGIKMYYRYVIYPLMNSSGGIITIEDITEEKILKEQVVEKEKNRVLLRMISGIAHEIRNPLTSIKTYVELLPRKKDNAEFQKQITKVVPNEVERVNKLIENLIDYVKPKAKNIEVVDVQLLVEYCSVLFSPTLNENNIHLNIMIDEGLTILADKDQMKQVFINLILNAIDAIIESRLQHLELANQITIEAHRDDEQVLINVSDNGVGMTPDEMALIFELFYTTKVKGSGIGMPLSKQMIEDNGGQIKIESQKFVGTQIGLLFKGAFDEQKDIDHR
ncbi:transporter substrate-binding domain-containing protein [Fusibacter sp. 3D3]|uniref:transporter substrate-binding domain-containing protein n=1 Tax=Fusibacter sp. 3D3 TaxID=1048380 RepID=UPI0015861A32|nr:transporter substrate-binding domain-containing protein [Fusibacter sp. 3D3]